MIAFIEVKVYLSLRHIPPILLFHTRDLQSHKNLAERVRDMSLVLTDTVMSGNPEYDVLRKRI